MSHIDGKGGGWATTLGKTQYDWLKNTLANSKADFKFVFIHNLTRGIGKDSRGGAEAADFYEWSGKNENGIYEFSKMRPGWDMPIHDLLVKYGVNVVFHGHDHFYAKQVKEFTEMLNTYNFVVYHNYLKEQLWLYG